MNQKFTLNIEAQAIDCEKRCAEKSDRSLSSLVGIGAGPANETDYKRHILERNESSRITE